MSPQTARLQGADAAAGGSSDCLAIEAGDPEQGQLGSSMSVSVSDSRECQFSNDEDQRIDKLKAIQAAFQATVDAVRLRINVRQDPLPLKLAEADCLQCTV